MNKCKKSYTVKVYECDQNSTLRFSSLFNLFQDMADLHSHEMGLGYDYCLDHGIGWVGASYAVKINRMPKFAETYTIETWPSAKTSISGIREFVATTETGERLFYASSQWVLVNLSTKRPIRIDDNVINYSLIPERVIDTTFPAIALPEQIDFTQTFPVRFDEVDINKHVNNAIYPAWASESVPRSFRQTHTITAADIAFKKPATYSDDICIETQISETGINETETLHVIKSNNDAKNVFARIRLKWNQCG